MKLHDGMEINTITLWALCVGYPLVIHGRVPLMLYMGTVFRIMCIPWGNKPAVPNGLVTEINITNLQQCTFHPIIYS